jgi:O-antigen chain-terminating methyltransferase
MGNAFYPEWDVKSIVNEIKSNISGMSDTRGSLQVKSGFGAAAGLNDVLKSIAIAQDHAAIGSTLPPMLTFKGLKHRIAQAVGAVVLRVGEIFTRDQRIVNQSLIDALSLICQELNFQNQKIEHLLNKEIIYQKELAVIQDKLKEIFNDPGLFDSRKTRQEGGFDDDFYVKFENRFRGERQEIKERLKVYLPEIIRSGAAEKQNLVLDIGCGRGEWLELLKEEGFRAKGIDSNKSMVEMCHKQNLDVSCADFFDFIPQIPDASISVVTAFHIIEHLSMEQLIFLFDETMRVLKPGGLLIMETLNPHNVLVGSCYFYCDPDHQKPVFPETLKFCAEYKCFSNVELRMLHPMEDWLLPDDGSPVIKRINEHFYGPQDYALMGWKA